MQQQSRRPSFPAPTRPSSTSSMPAMLEDPERGRSRAGATFFAALGRRARPTRWPRCAAPSWAPHTARGAIGAGDPEAPPPPAQRGRRQRSGAPAPALAGKIEALRAAPRHSIVARLMLIRAYRVRGHLEADLDPLGLDARRAASRARSRDLRLHRSRHGPADLHRQRARACETATLREIVAGAARDLLRHDRRRVHAHPGSRPEGLDPGAHRGASRNQHRVHRRGQARDPASG